jgi:hypothetical protein
MRLPPTLTSIHPANLSELSHNTKLGVLEWNKLVRMAHWAAVVQQLLQHCMAASKRLRRMHKLTVWTYTTGTSLLRANNRPMDKQ